MLSLSRNQEIMPGELYYLDNYDFIVYKESILLCYYLIRTYVLSEITSEKE